MINLKNLIDFLPFEFKEQDTYKVDGKGILERFLEICGSYFQDNITSDIDNILDLIDIDKTQQRYLNYLWEFLGELPFARTGEHTGVPNLSDEQIRTILKYSIPLLKIRGSRKFFEILFNMYGLTCTIVDPTDGEMDKWEKVDPLYDTDYSRYDKYNYDKIYGCAQCIQVDINIGGHGFTSPTKEFKAFKQSIDRLFDRFLPYNVSGNIQYGFDLAYNYKIVAEPLISPVKIVTGHITEVPIRVTVTSDYDDADLRYQVTGYDPSENKWSSKLYESGSIFYAKKGDQRYYFRSVGDNSVTTYVDVGLEYYTKSYHIYADLISGGTDLDNLVITGSNPKIEIKVTANMNYQGNIRPVDVQLINTHETKPSGSIWEITSAGTYEFVIADFPAKRVILNVTAIATNYTVICEPRNVNITNRESSKITIRSSDPNENTADLIAVLTTDPGVLVRNGSRWTPTQVGTFLFRCTKDTSGNSANYGTVVAYRLGYTITYGIGVSNKKLNLNAQGTASIKLFLTSGIHYSTFESANLYSYFDKNVNVYRKNTNTSGTWVKLGSVELDDRYVEGPDFYYGRSTDYPFNDAGIYKFESVGDPTKIVEVEVLEYVPVPESYLWLEPMNPDDENWYELEPYSQTEPTHYIKAGYQLTKNQNCQFYLRYGDGGNVITGIELEGSSETYSSNLLITMGEPRTYEFYYQGSVVTLTVKKVVPQYTLTLNPVSAELSSSVPEVSTIVTCTSDTGDSGDIIYETAPDVVHTSPYQFFTNLPGRHIFYVKDNPAVKAVFLVSMKDIVDKTELVWESNDISEQGIQIEVPEGTEWKLKIE
jgi:hypothetical protein